MSMYLSLSPPSTRQALGHSNTWEVKLGTATGRSEHTPALHMAQARALLWAACSGDNIFSPRRECSFRKNYHYDMKVGKSFLNKTGRRAEHKKDDYI